MKIYWIKAQAPRRVLALAKHLGLDVEQIHAKAIDVEISGAGDVKLAGRAESETVTLAGAGSYDAADLARGATHVTISGVGNGVVQAKDSLDVKISGMGKLEYISDPKVTQSVIGLGSVRKR